MPCRQRCPSTPDLLHWEPPPIEHRFAEPAITTAASLHGQLCRAMSQVLRDALERGVSRETVCERMSEYLGEEYTPARLNADTAESKPGHVINAIRLMAFCFATQDFRILSLIAEPLGVAIVDRKWLPAIEAAILEQHEAEVAARRKAAQEKVRRALS